ncbi:MAG: esterase family protein, partial [Bacteroidales bacterium]|nr:esterase family protein [Bacteroidales bacterium]
MKLLKRIAILVLILSVSLPACASVLDTIQVYSPSMKRKINVSVIKPDNITPRDTLPTVYLLHGYGDNN